jgi:hypothetical protein
MIENNLYGTPFNAVHCGALINIPYGRLDVACLAFVQELFCGIATPQNPEQTAKINEQRTTNIRIICAGKPPRHE